MCCALGLMLHGKASRFPQTPHIKASFAKRQEQGWKTQITVWKRVAD